MGRGGRKRRESAEREKKNGRKTKEVHKREGRGGRERKKERRNEGWKDGRVVRRRKERRERKTGKEEKKGREGVKKGLITPPRTILPQTTSFCCLSTTHIVFP